MNKFFLVLLGLILINFSLNQEGSPVNCLKADGKTPPENEATCKEAGTFKDFLGNKIYCCWIKGEEETDYCSPVYGYQISNKLIKAKVNGNTKYDILCSSSYLSISLILLFALIF